jgi:hypothetical protein
MDYDAIIAELQANLKSTAILAKTSGPVQQMSTGATAALFHIAIQLAQLNKNLEAARAAAAATPAAPAK